MKTTNFKSLRRMVVVVFAIIIACLAMLVCNITKSYADEYDFNQDCIEDQEANDWYDDCDTIRIKNHMVVNNPEEEAKNVDDVYGVKDGKFNVVHKYMFNKDGSYNSDFVFEYNYRGFYGDKQHRTGRKANVQYFYNSVTDELVLLAFGNYWNDHRYVIQRYADSCHSTALEDNQKYDNSKIKNISIANHVKHLYIDPEISCIGTFSLRKLCKCETVDICNHLYAASRMGDNSRFPGTKCLEKGSLVQLGTDTKDYEVNMPFINLFCESNRDKILEEKPGGLYASAKIVYNPDVNYDYISFKYDNNIESVKDSDGNILTKDVNFRESKDGKFEFYVNKNKANFHYIVKDNGKEISPVEDGKFVLDTKNVSIHHVEIIPNITIVGHVSSAEEKGVSDCRIQALKENGAELYSTLTDRDGNF